MKDKIKDSIDFVSRHYRHDAFPQEEVERSLGLRHTPWWRRSRNIAAIAVGATLTAAASLMIFNQTWQTGETRPTPAEITAPAAVSTDPLLEVRRIEFTDAPLPAVVAEIERVYGVKVTGGDDPSIRVSLSYEGNVTELLETVNSLFGTGLTVEDSAADDKTDR